MATSRRKPAIPPLRTLELRELQLVIANIRERLDQLDDAVASAVTTTGSTSTSSSANNANTAGTANALSTSRAFDLAGVVTGGPQNFDGTQNVTIEVLEVPLALLEQDSAIVGQVLAWDGSGGWTPATLIDPMSPIDHGALLGLDDDDHPHYLNEGRGDALYSPLGHTHDTSDVTGLVELIEDTIGASLVAGSGISITYNDTTGEVTVDATGGGGGGFANPMTNFGDLITGQSAGSPARLPIGLEGQVLRVVSGLPAWDDEASGGGSGADILLVSLASAVASHGGSAWAKIPLDTVSVDTNSIWDATNTRAVPKRAGYYRVEVRARRASSAQFIAGIGKNGALLHALSEEVTTARAVGGGALVYCNGTTDYIEAYAFCSSAINYTALSIDTFMHIFGPV